MIEFLKYHGAGNDFLLYDARTAPEAFPAERVAALCDRHTGVGSDGLMVLSEAEGYDFRMDFFNPDGSGGMMCGNGGRCIVAFARDLGIAPGPDGSYHFLAPDGPHTAWLLSEEGPVKTVRLGMRDVTEYYRVNDGWFLDTGTRHFITFVDHADSVDVEGLGRAIRHLPEFGPVGVNVNFVEIVAPGEIAVRTFEKGVEAETLACGTGITASAIATWLANRPTEAGIATVGTAAPACPTSTLVHARRHDLAVSFTPSRDVPFSADTGFSFVDITLTGPAERVARVLLP